MVEVLYDYLEEALKEYSREDLIHFMSIEIADSFAREYSYVSSGSSTDSQVYLGMLLMLTQDTKGCMEMALIKKNSIDLLSRLVKKKIPSGDKN